jgi:hypothetical protein
VNEVKKILRLAGEANTKKASAVPISLDDVIKMKTFCDAYFLVRARRYMVGERGFEPPSR